MVVRFANKILLHRLCLRSLQFAWPIVGNEVFSARLILISVWYRPTKHVNSTSKSNYIRVVTVCLCAVF